MRNHNRISIIGAGHVGATCAYALILKGVARELVLLDQHKNIAMGEAMDLQHAAALSSPVEVWSGTYEDAARSQIVIISAGVSSKPGESRLDLLYRNAQVIREIILRLKERGFDGIVLMTTNPVDILSKIAWEESGLSSIKVIGSGIVLDTARLRSGLSRRLKVEPRSIHSYIIGEHGDSEIASWSSSIVAGVPLTSFYENAKESDYNEILQEVRRAAPNIIKCKGYTSYAIASSCARICEAILRDEHTVMPVSTLLDGQYGLKDVYLSVPCVVGQNGIEKIIEVPLDEHERSGLHASAEVLKNAYEKLVQSEKAVST
jgi:L-lactate dehydrogenase